MLSGEMQGEIVKNQLQRVLSSPGFVRNERMSRFLRFIVEQQLNGRGSELKESLIGIEVFGRKPGLTLSRTRLSAAKPRGCGRGSPSITPAQAAGTRWSSSCRRRLHTAVSISPRRRLSQPKPTSRGRECWGVGRTCVVIAALAWWLLRQGSAPFPIAVLPLTNLSQNPADDYFADGITNELIRNLSILDGVWCAPRPRRLRSKASHETYASRKTACRRLRPGGSVLRSGKRLRINTQLFVSATTFRCGPAGSTGS
jgi:hypothetical protein